MKVKELLAELGDPTGKPAPKLQPQPSSTEGNTVEIPQEEIDLLLKIAADAENGKVIKTNGWSKEQLKAFLQSRIVDW